MVKTTKLQYKIYIIISIYVYKLIKTSSRGHISEMISETITMRKFNNYYYIILKYRTTPKIDYACYIITTYNSIKNTSTVPSNQWTQLIILNNVQKLDYVPLDKPAIHSILMHQDI